MTAPFWVLAYKTSINTFRLCQTDISTKGESGKIQVSIPMEVFTVYDVLTKSYSKYQLMPSYMCLAPKQVTLFSDPT